MNANNFVYKYSCITPIPEFLCRSNLFWLTLYVGGNWWRRVLTHTCSSSLLQTV